MAFDFPSAPTVGQTFNNYVWDGEKWVLTASAPNQGGVIAIKVYTASGTYEPSANMTTCVVEVRGSGGGGGSARIATVPNGAGGGGGGQGSYSRSVLTAEQVGASQPIFIGAAGVGGTAPAGLGTAGSGCAFGTTLVTAFGGGGGGHSDPAVINGAAGVGGAQATGQYVEVGSHGGKGYTTIGGAIAVIGGIGGGSGGGAGGLSGVGGVAAGYGAGGGGAGVASATTTNAFSGGDGKTGIVIITEYGITALSPSSSASGNVRYDLPQSLTTNQQVQARANIDVLKKNYIINGAMMISQENGTTATPNSGYYPVDQFHVYYGRTGSWTVSIAQTTGYPITPGGSPYRLQVYATTGGAMAAGEYLVIRQAIEGFRAADLKLGTAAAKTITIQFGVKAPAGTYCVALYNAASDRSYIAEYVIAAGESNTATVKSVTLQLDTSGTWAKDQNVGLYIHWSLTCGTTYQGAANSWTTGAAKFATANQHNFLATTGNDFHLFDVSLTEGTVAPPFVVPDYARELALCQRYWWATSPIGVPPQNGDPRGVERFRCIGTNHQHTVRLPTQRTFGTVTFYSAGSGIAGVFRDMDAVIDRAVLLASNGMGSITLSITTSVAGNLMSGHIKSDARL